MVVSLVRPGLLHVLERVVHPSKVPLEIEAQPSRVLGRILGGDTTPCMGLLSNHDDARVCCLHDPIESAQEGYSLLIVDAAMLVGNPLPILLGADPAVEVPIEHTGDSVATEPVDVIPVGPEDGRPDQEAADLVPPEVEHLRPPVPLLTLTGVLVLEARCAVVVGKAAAVLAEVRRHKVHDDADVRLVQCIHEELEVVRRTEQGVAPVVPGDLVPPRAGVWVVRKADELDVIEMQVLHVLHEERREVPVVQETARFRPPPRRQVHFIDCHRLLQQSPIRPELVTPMKPPLVPPGKGIWAEGVVAS
mmetsp:Transcript_46595/g.129602  ORF Transcript_46595/g.129602 Transcript_46595/m.129602 type:complete len:305 (+) Transcript_46595:1084-1998(+)